jgi:hypothetical protein
MFSENVLGLRPGFPDTFGSCGSPGWRPLCTAVSAPGAIFQARFFRRPCPFSVHPWSGRASGHVFAPCAPSPRSPAPAFRTFRRARFSARRGRVQRCQAVSALPRRFLRVPCRARPPVRHAPPRTLLTLLPRRATALRPSTNPRIPCRRASARESRRGRESSWP